MFNNLRSMARGIFGILLVALLVVAFVFWGIADSFTGFSNRTIAYVGDIEIDRDEFQLRYAQQLGAVQNELGQVLTTEQARALGVDRQVLSSLINLAALTHTAADLGIAHSDSYIADLIINDKAFHNAQGDFDEPTFRDILRRNGLSEDLYVDGLRQNAAHQQLLGATMQRALIAKPLLTRLFYYYLEQRRAHYMVVPLSLIDDVSPPTEEELHSFYNQTSMRFAAPERRSGTVLAVSPAHFADTIAISETEIRATYEANIDDYATEEKREIDQIILPDNEAIEIAQNLISEGEGFDEIRAAFKKSAADTDLGVLTQDDFISADLSALAFSLAQGETSAPTESALGTVIMRVRKIIPSTIIPLNDIAETLRQEIMEERIADELILFSETIMDERASGATLEEIAQKFDIPVNKVTKIDAAGNQEDGMIDPIVAQQQGLTEQLFSSIIGEDLTVTETPENGFFWARLDKIDPSYNRPYEDVQTELEEQWYVARRRNMLEAMADHLVSQGNKTGNFETIETALNQEKITSELMLRNSVNETFTSAIVTELFKVQDGGFFWMPINIDNSIMILQLDEIKRPNLNNKESADYVFAAETGRLRDDIGNFLVSQLRDIYGTQINIDNLDFAVEQIRRY